MNKLTFDDWSHNFNQDDGVLPDGVITETTTLDWPALLAVVRDNGWTVQTLVDGIVVPDIKDDELLNGDPDKSVTFAVFPQPGLQLNFFVRPDSPIGFDFDLREITGQSQLDAFMNCLQTIGDRLKHQIRLMHEGDDSDNYFYAL